MITQITPIEELKQMWLEIFLNKTDKVADVSAESGLNDRAHPQGWARILVCHTRCSAPSVASKVVMPPALPA